MASQTKMSTTAAASSSKPALKPVDEAQPSLTRLAQMSDDEEALTDLSAISEFSPESKKRNRPSSPAYGETRTTKKRTVRFYSDNIIGTSIQTFPFRR
jgi:hypothetical protein